MSEPLKVFITYSHKNTVVKRMGRAKSDLTTAKSVVIDISTAVCKKYKSVEDFEQKTGIQLPKDIAAMLTQQ